MEESGIKIFQAEDGKTEIQVVVQAETVWLSQKQMAVLFEKDSDTIGLHLRKIFKSGELNEKATTEKYSVVQKEGNRNVTRTLSLYNLDAIISVGYRVNSKRGIQFRIWANQVLKEFLLKGYAINERLLSSQNEQLKSLKESVLILTKIVNQKKLSPDESEGLLKIITDYAYALDILDQYDHQNLKISDTSDKELFKISYSEAQNISADSERYIAMDLCLERKRIALFKVLYQLFIRHLMAKIYIQALMKKQPIYFT
jgi:hypothetical protein